tara:strand:- start:219 stop:536 length:318 start_codon:yes stop_codon:yes gene_type:complete
MEKRKFLYYNLNKLNQDKINIIETYIKKNNLNFKENNNGFLINLSQMEEKHIDYIYDLYNIKEKNIRSENKIECEKLITQKEKNSKESYLKYNMNNLEKLIFSIL